MADATTTTEQSSGATATRLSPKGRSLRREHDLDAGDVRVSGGARVKVDDVERVLDDRADDLGRDPLAIHQMFCLGSTYDHRSVDGGDAVRILLELKQKLETADLLGGAA